MLNEESLNEWERLLFNDLHLLPFHFKISYFSINDNKVYNMNNKLLTLAIILSIFSVMVACNSSKKQVMVKSEKFGSVITSYSIHYTKLYDKRYGGKISSEWMIPKIMQIADESPDIYKAADRFVEAADWVIS